MTGWVLDTLLATSALLVLVLIVREPIRRQFGAAAAYALWLIPAARMAMPPITQTVERVVPASDSVALAPLAFASVATAAPDPTWIERLGGWPTLLMIIWAIGTGLFLVLGVLRYRRQRHVILDGSVQLAKLGNIRLVRSEAVRGPIAFGIVDRVIAVPHDFDQRFDATQRRLALDHELSHHRSGDLIVNHIAFVLLGLQWFNPVAWFAHAAFRFDQEAACDARILDAAGPDDRAAYGHAIAKAASGRTLLFASALDHHQNLHRRLKSMLTNPTPSRRLAGKLAVVGALAFVLPLTATWATRYVDVAAPEAPTPPLAPVAPQAPLPPLPNVAPLPPTAPLPPLPPIGGNATVMIDGKPVAWRDLSPAKKAEIRASIDEARRGLAATQIDRGAIRAELQEAMAEMKRNQGEMRRDLEEARREVDDAMREIDDHADDIRRAGQDPEQMKALVRASLKSIEHIDVEAITRQAMAGVDPAMIERSVAAAQAGIDATAASIARAEAEIAASGRRD